jgi:hypothetical protein
VSKICSDNSIILFLSIREGPGDDSRGASSTFKNMPFLLKEDALLGARRASFTTLYITY